MIYNSSAKTVYEVFSTEKPKYVDLAIDALNKEPRTIAILKKKFGPKYDGVGGVRFLSYAETEYLKHSLRRIDSYIPAIKVLVEVHNETKSQILNRFYKKNDTQILSMIRNLTKNNDMLDNIFSSKNSILTTYKITEELLVSALEHVENLDDKRIYMYYYGIARNKMKMNIILKLFPDYNEDKIKKILLDIQEKLPSYINIEKENMNEQIDGEIQVKKRNYTKSTVTQDTDYLSGVRYNSLFDYFIDKNDTPERNNEICEIILDYMEFVDSNKDKVVKKIFGDSYNQLAPNVELTKEEKCIFDNLRVRIKKYIERILSIRYEKKGRVYNEDRVFLTQDNEFKAKLSDYFEKHYYPLAMDVFSHYLNSHQEIKDYFSKFYDLDTFDLKSNIYTSKNDVKIFKSKVKEVNNYIKKCYAVSTTFKKKLVYYFKKRFMSDARVQLVYELCLEAIETLSDEERLLLQNLYGEDYNSLNVYADITSEDVEIINQIIERIGNYVSHSLKTIYTYKTNIFMYFHKPGMTAFYKEKLDAEIKRFIANSSSKGKYVAVMLYGETYSNLNSSVNLSKEQVELFYSFLDEINEHIKSVESTLKKIGKPIVANYSFLNYFKDSSISDEENNIIIESVKKTIDNDDSKYKSLFIKYYDENYIFNNNIEISKEDKMNIRYFRRQIALKVFGGELPKSIYDMAITGHTNDARKIKIIKETDKFIESIDETTKNILRKVYGFDYHSFNSEVNLTSYERFIINKFNLELNAYIDATVPLAKAKKPLSEGYVKTANGVLPKKFFSFLSDVKTNMTLEELTKDATSYVNRSKSKYVLSSKKLYGEELLELDESITPTKEEVRSARMLIRDLKKRYSLKDTSILLKLPENILDNFNVSYNETNINMIINRINYNISARDSAFSHILHENYGVNLTEKRSAEVEITANDLILFNGSIKVANNQLTKDLIDYNLKDDLLEYFYSDLSNREELIAGITEKLDAMNKLHGMRFKKLIKFMYDDNFKLIRPMQLKDFEVETFNKIIKDLNKTRKQPTKISTPRPRRKFKTFFFDNFLFEGEEEIPESRKSTIVKMVRGSKSAMAKLALDLFGINLDQKCRDEVLYNANKREMNDLIKMITKRLTNTYSRGLFMLADNFIDQFILETDLPEIKESIRKYLINYIAATQSKHKSIIDVAYDEDYNLKKEYIFDGDKRSYNSFINSIRLAVDKYRKKLINGENKKDLPKDKSKTSKVRQPETTKMSMMNLGKNEYLALTNDLFDIKLIGNEEIQTVESKLTDDVINNAYNELNDSETIMDLLMISSDTLVEFYISHIDDLKDPTEAFNYLINLGDKDVIKKLMISPLFLRVVNYLSDIERQVIYLKLVQVSNSSLTDERIAEITKVDINSIREYEIMTKDDKVNSLNKFIIKRKY